MCPLSNGKKSYSLMTTCVTWTSLRHPMVNSPFPVPKVTKIIDSLHIRNHKRESCKKNVGEKLKELKKKNPDLNTMAAEQVFVWLGGFNKILCAMDKCHCIFFLHRMCVRRNHYTELCYKEGSQCSPKSVVLTQHNIKNKSCSFQ